MRNESKPGCPYLASLFSCFYLLLCVHSVPLLRSIALQHRIPSLLLKRREEHQNQQNITTSDTKKASKIQSNQEGQC
jgi:hypothetical protein